MRSGSALIIGIMSLCVLSASLIFNSANDEVFIDHIALGKTLPRTDKYRLIEDQHGWPEWVLEELVEPTMNRSSIIVEAWLQADTNQYGSAASAFVMSPRLLIINLDYPNVATLPSNYSAAKFGRLAEKFIAQNLGDGFGLSVRESVVAPLLAGQISEARIQGAGFRCTFASTESNPAGQVAKILVYVFSFAIIIVCIANIIHARTGHARTGIDEAA